MRGDTALMLRQLAKMKADRRLSLPQDVKLETVLPEAELLAAAGDIAGALATLSPTLDALPASDVEILQTAVGAGVLIRAIALRATLEARVGNGIGAMRWSSALRALWAHPDAFLRPIVSSITAMSGARH